MPLQILYLLLHHKQSKPNDMTQTNSNTQTATMLQKKNSFGKNKKLNKIIELLREAHSLSCALMDSGLIADYSIDILSIDEAVRSAENQMDSPY